MPATLTSLRDRVEQLIADTSNVVLSTAALEEGIRQALDIYSKARPLVAVSLFAISDDIAEVNISSLTGLLNISRVWLPYTATSPENPPLWRNFEHWQDLNILYLIDYMPAIGDVARIFYTKKQTLNGLDGATVTTFAADDETLLAMGAAGYAVVARAREITEVVALDQQVPLSKQLLDWARFMIGEFKGALGITGGVGGVKPGEKSQATGPVVMKKLRRDSFYADTYPATPGDLAA